MSTSPLASRVGLLWRRHFAGIEPERIQAEVEKNGRLSYPLVFLTLASCAIATLGLLLNSVAVIIGAMLIAPLMGPIVLFGFSIAHTDTAMAARGGLALLVGVAGALATAIVIVKLAPFIPPTPEILARTNPNLFDLLIAVFSGLAAGYAIIRGQSGVVVGVAIATALMPPLAVVGYGVATANPEIFRGAALLFLTNMLAIAFSVAFVALWYGLGRLHAPKELLWKTVAAGVVLALLSLPLARTLKDSVRETWRAKQVEALMREAAAPTGTTLDRLELRTADDGETLVHAVLLTPQYDPDLAPTLEQALAQRLNTPVRLRLDQIETGGLTPARLESALSPFAESRAAIHPLSSVRDWLPAPLLATEIDAERKLARLDISPLFGGTLAALRDMESRLRERFPDWSIEVVPPPMPLPAIPFGAKDADLSDDAVEGLDLTAWALKRWRVRHAQVSGFAATWEAGRTSKRLAANRATRVADYLVDHGIEIEAAGEYPAVRQSSIEREAGRAALRRAVIVPVGAHWDQT